MPISAVLLPLFVQVILTIGLFMWMAYYRVTLLRNGSLHPRDVALRQPRDVALRQPNWPPHVLQVTHVAHNQLETPVLFYVLTILAIVTRQADLLFVVMAWLYVLVRIGHACVHVTINRLSVRGAVFGLSMLILMMMWLIFMVRILASSS